MKSIVPGLITEGEIYHLPKEIVSAFADVCSDIVIKYINDYCNANKNSNDPMTKECVDKLVDAFKSINMKNEYLRSKSAKDIVDTLGNLSYSDIYFEGYTSIEVLQKYKYCIEVVLNSSKDMNEGRVVTGKDFENFLILCESFPVLCTYTLEEKEMASVEKIKKIVKNNRSFFKSAPFNMKGSTLFTRFRNKKETLNTLLYGIEFLIENIEKGSRPESWRYL